jgi:hypothetical protein
MVMVEFANRSRMGEGGRDSAMKEEKVGEKVKARNREPVSSLPHGSVVT